MKSTTPLVSAARIALRPSQTRLLALRQTPSLLKFRSRQPKSQPPQTVPFYSARNFSATHAIRKGLQPDTAEPKAPNPSAHHTTSHNAEPASISDEEYHALADGYIDSLLRILEETAEDSTKGMDVEYSAGVLTLKTLTGTYVINKQPPNKQIWLSSPISGPFRYDWVISGDSMHHKEGTETHEEGAGGKWTYLRDGSTLNELIEKELGLEVGTEEEHKGEVYSGSE